MNDFIRLLGLFKPYLGWLLLGIFISLITLLANVTLMAISGWFITSMAIAGLAGVSMNYFTPAAIIRGSAIARTAGRYGERLITHEATFRLLSELRVWFYEKLEPLAPSGLDSYRSGDLLSRLRADIDTLNNMYLRILVPTAVAIIAAIGFVTFLAFYNIQLAIIELTFLFIAGVAVPWGVTKLSYSTGEKITHTSSQLRSAVVNDLQGMSELLIYGADKEHSDKIKKLSEKLAAQQKHMSRLSGISQGALVLSTNLAMWMIIITSIPLVSSGELLRPHLAMLALFVLASFEAVIPLPLAFQSMAETLSAARRIFSVADKQPVIKEPKNPAPIPQSLTFQFKQVDFRYRHDKPLVLKNINLQIKQKSKTAIIGMTGSGKSTLAHLLVRFHQADAGEILLNEQTIESYNSDDLRTHISTVSQHNHLFNTSIKQNLLLAKPNATQDELEEVCQTALIHDFITEQPDAYNTVVGEIGVRLSGGQSQRLAIARALLKPSSLLVLDEPTEGIDPQNSLQLMKNLNHWVDTHEQGLLLITHNLQGLALMDQVVLMENGEVIQSGKHHDLLNSSLIYQQLQKNTPLLGGAR